MLNGDDIKVDDKIIIKAADQGGATLIMDKTFYKNTIMELFNRSRELCRIRKQPRPYDNEKHQLFNKETLERTDKKRIGLHSKLFA